MPEEANFNSNNYLTTPVYIFSNMFHVALHAYVKQIIIAEFGLNLTNGFTLKIISEENVSPRIMDDDIRYSADGRITVPTVGIGRKWVSAVMADIIGDL